MKTYNLKLKIITPFGNLFRTKTVAIIVKNSKNEFLLGSKPSFYPPTITRLLGGGFKEKETPENATKRELVEELGVEVDEKHIKHLVIINIKAKDETGEIYNTKINLLNVDKPIDEYSPGDDVKFIDILKTHEMKELVKAYENLSELLWYKGEEGEFCWKDYGQVYSVVHSLALEHS